MLVFSRGRQRIDPQNKRRIMRNPPIPWSVYLENQSKAGRCYRITNQSWGIEKGLNKFLTDAQSSSAITTPQEFQSRTDRAINTGTCVERNRARLRRVYLQQDPEQHAEQFILARLLLTEIYNSVSTDEWELVNAVANGISYREIAASRGITTGSLRTRLSRLRARLAAEKKSLPGRG